MRKDRNMGKQSIVAEASKVLTEDDLATSCTARMLEDLQKALQLIDKRKINRVLDLGCGFGGVTKLVADFFSATEVWGADHDTDRLKVAERRGLRTMTTDIRVDKLPFPSGYFDLVISFGVIEHLRYYYDNLISESYRVINEGGYFLLSWSNLGSYTQRISLLLGYQPTDIEISKEILVGTLYNSGQPSAGHTSSATLEAMKQLLEHYGFTMVGAKKGKLRIIGAHSNWSPLLLILDYLCPLSLARHIIMVARK